METSHPSDLCLDSAELMGLLLYRIFSKAEYHTKDSLFDNLPTFSQPLVNDIANRTFVNKTRDEIQTSGFVIHTL